MGRRFHMIRRKKGEAMTARSNGTIGATAEATWAVEHFARFWANPDPTKPTGRLAKDIIGRWPDGLTLRGIDEYMGRRITIGTLIPAIRLDVVEHAVNGNFAFIRWRSVRHRAQGPLRDVWGRSSLRGWRSDQGEHRSLRHGDFRGPRRSATVLDLRLGATSTL